MGGSTKDIQHNDPIKRCLGSTRRYHKENRAEFKHKQIHAKIHAIIHVPLFGCVVECYKHVHHGRHGKDGPIGLDGQTE